MCILEVVGIFDVPWEFNDEFHKEYIHTRLGRESSSTAR